MIEKCDLFLEKDLLEKSTNNDKKPLAICKVCNDGIYHIHNNIRRCHYNFGEVSSVIYINNCLLIINFTEGTMLKYNTTTSEVTNCSYPDDYLFQDFLSPTVNETIEGNLITIGGYLLTDISNTEVKMYNINTDTWYNDTSLPYGVHGHATVVVDDDIYVIGGDTEIHDIVDCTRVIRYRNDEWKPVSSLLHKRFLHLAILRDNCIYVYGGMCVDIRPECYNINTDVWSYINIKTNIFYDVRLYNSVCDKQIAYTYDRNNNIYSISLVDYTKTLLYNNRDISRYCLVLMNL